MSSALLTLTPVFLLLALTHSFKLLSPHTSEDQKSGDEKVGQLNSVMKEESNQVNTLPKVNLEKKYAAGNSIREIPEKFYKIKHVGIN